MVRPVALLSCRRHADGAEDCPTEIALKQGRIVRGQEAIIERPDGKSGVPITFRFPLHCAIRRAPSSGW